MGILIDSNVLINIERKGSSLSSAISGRETEKMFISVVSASEILHGT